MHQGRRQVPAGPAGVTESVVVQRLSGAAGPPPRDLVVVEKAVTIAVQDAENFTILCTPSDLEALAAGFLFAESMIESLDDIVSIRADGGNSSVEVELADPSKAVGRRNLIIASSCGMCGVRNLKRILYTTAPCENRLRVGVEFLHEAIEKMYPMQEIFRETGAAHAAGLFSGDGRIVAFGEDIGRHSALDKAVGKCLLEGRSMVGCAVALSGRVSFEMVTKAARAGLELIAAISAPSSLAVEAARRWNITLCGFVREDRANVYAHPERIIGMEGVRP